MVTLAEKQAVRSRCPRNLHGHKALSADVELERMAQWCRTHDAAPDVYGRGVLIEDFERKIAALLGKDAAVFMPSGTMAQQIALRIWAEETRIPHIAMHPTSHLELHEQRGYAHLHGLRATLLGERERPLTEADLRAYPEPLAALLVELPLREVGGLLPDFEELLGLRAAAAARGTKLHLDGARLWECRAFYAGRSYADICAGFDSVYVSFYKGIGALSGAMLAGPADFIAQARIWLRRHGGNLYQMHPYVVSAAMNFDARLAAMPAFLARARGLAAALGEVGSLVAVKPAVPQVNMFHVFVRGEPEALDRAHLAIAQERGLWLAGRFSPAAVPGWSWFEVYIGENALELSDAEVVKGLRDLQRQAAELAGA